MTKTIEAEELALTPATAAPREAGRQEAGTAVVVEPPAQNIAPAAPVAAQGQSGLLTMIERVAVNPEIDVDKLKQLLEMQERIMDREAKIAYDDAMSEMQPQLPVVGERGTIKDKHGGKRSSYALWEDINEQIKPVLARHGFSVTFRVKLTNGDVVVTGIVSHRAGHREETTLPLPVDASGNKNPVQAIGSSTSYGKRYTAGLLLNLTSRGEDDDGNAAGAGETITEEQATWISGVIEETDADLAKFCRFLKVGSVAEIPAAKYETAKKELEAHKAWKAKQTEGAS